MDRQPLTLTMEEKENYLSVCATGMRSRENVKELTLKVFNTDLEKHLTKVII
jgi:hypothetical protein